MDIMIISSLVSIVFGLLLLIAPNLISGIGFLFNLNVLDLDAMLKPYRALIGIVFLAIAAWVLYVAMGYPELAYLHVVWVVAFIFGVLYVFFPVYVDRLSNLANLHLFPTDKYILGSSKLMGIVLVVVGLILLVISLIY